MGTEKPVMACDWLFPTRHLGNIPQYIIPHHDFGALPPIYSVTIYLVGRHKFRLGPTIESLETWCV